jgi:glycosyltransferase involved in cell wall biosynthesis
MASGVPVVASNAGGLSEIIIPGVTGYMSNVKDIESMTQQSLEILRNDDVLKAFKKRAAAHAKKYDIQNIVPEYEKLYQRFLK